MMARRAVTPEWSQGDRLRKAREHAGLSQTELAAKIGMSRNTISNYELRQDGGDVPWHQEQHRKTILKAWATATGVSVAWLEGNTE